MPSMPRSRRLSCRPRSIRRCAASPAWDLSRSTTRQTAVTSATTFTGARRWLSAGSRIDPHDLKVAGAAAGIAAAFNTPLGGIVFGLEQLSRRRGMAHSTLVISVIVLAGLVAVAAFGNITYFGRLRVQALDWSLLGPGLLVALASG